MFNETLLEEGYAQIATFPPNVRYVDRFVAAQEGARAAATGLWGLSPEHLAVQTDRGNGIGSSCAPKATPPPKTKTPTSPQPPLPTPVPTPTPDVPPPPPRPKSIPPASGNSCPPNAPIKGNQSGIYHVPGGGFYDRTNPEECFANEAEAQAAGYRASKR